MKLDLNCDLGEGESARRTRALMRWVTSVNVACGGHAGSVESMEQCALWAKEAGVRLGAHPGSWDREGFGRAGLELTPGELELLLLRQVGGLTRVARRTGARLCHVKLHGALYHAVEQREDLRGAYLKAMARWWPGVRIYARAGGGVARAARRARVPVWEEVFADRAYDEDGDLVPRTEPGAVFTKGAEVKARVRMLLQQGRLPTVSGKGIRLRGQTICVHSDTDSSVALARTVRRVIDRYSGTTPNAELSVRWRG